MVKAHARLRRLKKSAQHDYERVSHTPSEHKSHGFGSYRELHHTPGHVRRAERQS
jgi:hypothetical protein